MHASIADLLKLRDREPVAAELHVHVDGCADCAARLAELDRTRAALRELPLREPPAGLWPRIEAAARELPQRRPRRRWPSAGIAAALIAGTGVALWYAVSGGAGVSPASPRQVATTAQAPAQLVALKRESSQLEAALRALRNRDTVMTARTADTIATLQDGIALIDYRLNQSAVQGLAPTDTQRLWQQRVNLMRSLVAVRYVQASEPSM